jgi:hypothetical protein
MSKKNRQCYRFEQNFETVSWNKEIKRTARKTKFQTSTCAQHETPKLKCRTYGKSKIQKKINEKIRGFIWNHGHGHGQAPPGARRARAGPGQRLTPWTFAGLSGHAPWERGF